MATITLELPDAILEQVRVWVGADEQAFLAGLIGEAVRERALADLHAKLEASQRSGRVHMDEAAWNAMRDRVLARAAHRIEDVHETDAAE